MSAMYYGNSEGDADKEVSDGEPKSFEREMVSRHKVIAVPNPRHLEEWLRQVEYRKRRI